MNSFQPITTARPESVDPMPFPLPAPGSVGPPACYSWLRSSCPAALVRLPLDATARFVTRYSDVRSLLADPRLIRPTIDEWPPTQAVSGEPGLVTMMELNGHRHRVLRAAIADAFSARAVRRRRSRIRRQADGILDDLEQAGQPADLVTGFAEPFPLLVVCDLVGIPYRDREIFLRPADDALGAMITLEAGRRATKVLRAYLTELVDRKRREPGDDVVSNLVRHLDAGKLVLDDVISFGLSILVAGYRTSTMFLANALLALLSRPADYAMLRDNPGLLPGATDELLRYLPVMNGNVLLVAVEDFALHGHTVPAGHAVVPSIAAANLDPTVFHHADQLNLGRTRNPHLTFGRGTHNCVGAHLARAELEIGLAAVLRRFPAPRLATPEHDLVWEDDAPAKSPIHLPVTW